MQNNTYYKSIEKVNQDTAEKMIALYHRIQKEQLIGKNESTIEMALMKLYSSVWNSAAVNLGLSDILNLADDLMGEFYTNMANRRITGMKDLTQSQIKVYARDMIHFAPLINYIAETENIQAD